MIKSGFITVFPYMRNELKLKGNELLIYALINGFTQRENGCFYGTQEYIAEWCGISRGQANRILKRLQGKELIHITEQGNGRIYRALKSKSGNDFLMILPFMRNELKLKGSQLLVYGVLYSHTHSNGTGCYRGKLGYIENWCGINEKQTIAVLKELTERGLVEKMTLKERGAIVRNWYATTYRQEENTLNKLGENPSKSEKNPSKSEKNPSKSEKNPKKENTTVKSAHYDCKKRTPTTVKSAHKNNNKNNNKNIYSKKNKYDFGLKQDYDIELLEKTLCIN